MNPGAWIDAIVQWGARMPHTLFALLWTAVIAGTHMFVDSRSWPARAYYGAYVFCQAFAAFLAAGWLMLAIHG